MHKFKIKNDEWLIINGKFTADKEKILVQSCKLDQIRSFKLEKYESRSFKEYSICLGVGDHFYLFIKYEFEEFEMLREDLKSLEEYIGDFIDWDLL